MQKLQSVTEERSFNRSSDPLERSEPRQDYIPIDPQFLYPDKLTEFAIYVYIPEKNRYVLFKAEGDAIERHRLDALSDKGKKIVYVPKRYASRVTSHLSKNLAEIVHDSTLSVVEKANQFHLLASMVLKELFESPPDRKLFMESVAHVGNALSDLIVQDQGATRELNRLRSYDYKTYSHSLNVCVLSVGLYVDLFNDQPKERIRDLSRGLLLHDIGKLDIPPEITNKPGPLNRSEWELMKSHPIKGVERLSQDHPLSDDSMLITLYHHESIDGSGYPVGMKKERIPFTSRLCKVVDVFDALTSNRAYKDRIPPYQALSMMIKDMRHQVDQDLLRSFILFLEKMGKVETRKVNL